MSGLSMLAAFAGVTLVVAAVGLVLPGRQLADRRRVTSRLRALSDPDLPAVHDGKEWGWHRVVSWLGERVAARTADPLAGLRTDLERAGYTHPSAGAYYLGARVVLVIALAVLGGLAGLTYEGGGLSIVLGVVAGSCAGYLTPSLYLGNRVRGRQQAIRAGLSDALDVIVMCVESGSPVTAAVDYLADESRPRSRCPSCSPGSGGSPVTRRPPRPAAALELAIMLPFLVLVFSAVVDFARVLYVTQAMQGAAYAGAVTAGGTALTPGYPGTATAAGQAAAVRTVPGLAPALTTDAVTVTVANGTATVKVAYDFPLLTAALVPSQTVRLQRTAIAPVAQRPGD